MTTLEVTQENISHLFSKNIISNMKKHLKFSKAQLGFAIVGASARDRRLQDFHSTKKEYQ